VDVNRMVLGGQIVMTILALALPRSGKSGRSTVLLGNSQPPPVIRSLDA
jgi:hypothetical protein